MSNLYTDSAIKTEMEVGSKPLLFPNGWKTFSPHQSIDAYVEVTGHPMIGTLPRFVVVLV